MPQRKQETKQDDTRKATTDPAITVKKRGRPAGSKNKTIRKDREVQTEKGENTKYIDHDMRLMHLPIIDINDAAQVKQRIDEYFTICSQDDMKPSVASLALSFNVSRFVLFDMVNGRNQTIKNSECVHTIKTAYDVINSYYEHLMNNGKINPVAGIFLMKNNLGYKDTTDYVVTANTEKQETIADISNKAGLLD